jgi:hypothetical protein
MVSSSEHLAALKGNAIRGLLDGTRGPSILQGQLKVNNSFYKQSGVPKKLSSYPGISGCATLFHMSMERYPAIFHGNLRIGFRSGAKSSLEHRGVQHTHCTRITMASCIICTPTNIYQSYILPRTHSMIFGASCVLLDDRVHYWGGGGPAVATSVQKS